MRWSPLLAVLIAGTLPGCAPAAGRPVVVELFTSESCSSCPPADAYLTEMAQGRPGVLPLAFHVTYWDGRGWNDPYSLAAATARQAGYAARLGGGAYTPEIVVDGRSGHVGSRRGEVEAAIAAARRAAKPGPKLSVSRGPGGVTIDVGPGSGAASVFLIGYDTRHVSSIGGGENGGRTLVDSNVVRSIKPVAPWSGAAIQKTTPAPAGEHIAVLLQAPDGTILGATREGG
jgi:hypothetical protein